MKNKFTITEEEKCRILNLHESAILKENNLLNENTVALSASENSFSTYGSWSKDSLRLYKGTTFKVSPTIKNSLVTTTKVAANFIQYGTFGRVYGNSNKAFVVCDCNNKTLYLSDMTDKQNDDKDIKNNSKAKWILGDNMLSMINLCKTATAIKTDEKKKTELVKTPPDEQKIISGTKEDKLNKDIDCKNKNPYNALTDGGLNWKKESQKWISDKCNGTTPCILGNTKTNINLRNAFCNKTWPTDQNNLQKLDKYTFNFDEIMKAIDVTGKCPKKSDKVDSDKVESDKNVTDDEFNKYIDGAAPVDKKLSDEDYYKLIN